MKELHMVIEKKERLTEDELAQIKALADLCNQHDGIELKLNWERLSNRRGNHVEDFLYYQDGRLVGFLAMYSFVPTEIEISGMVHPKYRCNGIFRSLTEAAMEECKTRSIPKMIFIVEHRSAPGKAFAGAIGADYEFSEYVMELEKAVDDHEVFPLTLCLATEDDVEAIVSLNSLCFNMPEESAREMTTQLVSDNRPTYIVTHAGEKIGKISCLLAEDQGFIYGFCVHPLHQGKGYGRQILLETVKMLQRKHYQKIALEVAVENSNALRLYQSCGFRVTTANDYYVVVAGSSER